MLPGRSLIAAITNGNGVVLVWSGLLVFTSAIAQFAGPLLLFRIIDGISWSLFTITSRIGLMTRL